ncbi:hypothetical protein [Sulfuriflexus mobilis]|uniref:hypothetical protein n=1 Tax=Sulfuriflexus mobilis TaxID=1811807 RepID=UPI000F82403D|nr:hypothetical protein [Sulfuriflexus mobilis]
MNTSNVLNKTLITAVSAILLSMPALSLAGHADKDDKARSGTVVCGGNQLNRLPGSDANAANGTEAHRANYVFRNYANGNISIDRMQFFDAQGATLYDTAISGLPTFNNDVLGPDNIIEPNQTAHLSLDDVIGDISLPRNNRPIQLRIDWSAASRVLKPDMVLVRIIRRRENVGTPELPDFRIREERSRHLYECRHITR